MTVLAGLGGLGLILLSVGLLLALREERNLRARQETEWADERQLLLTRIQAPEVGVFDSLEDSGDEDPAYVHFDEDEIPD